MNDVGAASGEELDGAPRVSGREAGRRWWRQLPLLAGLVVLWMVLWGQVSVVSALSGIVAAIVVTRFFYLPPVELSGRLNLWYLAVFLVRFFADVVSSSFQVAFQGLDPRPIPRSSVVKVQLRTRSDLILTLEAIAISLIPGSLVVEADRERGILFLHAFPTRTLADVDAIRRSALAMEERLVLAIGSAEDLAHLRGEATIDE